MKYLIYRKPDGSLPDVFLFPPWHNHSDFHSDLLAQKPWLKEQKVSAGVAKLGEFEATQQVDRRFIAAQNGSVSMGIKFNQKQSEEDTFDLRGCFIS